MVHLLKPYPQIAVYIHIPFCVSKCHYCDFNSIGLGKNSPPELEYLESLRQEMKYWGFRLRNFSEYTAQTVFLGGGTPSLFQASSIASILQDLQGQIAFAEDLETTLEMNPKTASLEKMQGLRQAGVKRLSIGVQSLDDKILSELGRAHDAEDALQTLEWAFALGFEKISMDLMYGLPGQSLTQLESGLKRLDRFPLQHLSAYELIVEENTPFYERYWQNRLLLPETAETLEMRERIFDFAKKKQMEPYEISNYASRGFESKHNLHYWNYDSFIGLGAGAVSFLEAEELSEAILARIPQEHHRDLYGLRLTNPRSLKTYQAQKAPLADIELEPISRSIAMAEFMMMGLRKTAGIDYNDFKEKFSEDMPLHFQEAILKSSAKGLLEVDEQGCRFTQRGVLLSNEVLKEFF